ncbi:TadE/TadG family type IV pilus assembly protein [Streptomyces sp. NPDC001262]|uniref:TadE/TadG family type IV pilus assembly protein n=1 Tax=unclassified Streptomyces TaxID=2593676 RepID=UPI0036CA2E71
MPPALRNDCPQPRWGVGGRSPRNGAPNRGGWGACPPRNGKGRVRGNNTPRDRGSVSVEFLGFLPLLLAVALGAITLGLAAFAAQQAATGARAAARTATLDEPRTGPEAAARSAMTGWVGDRAAVSAGRCPGQDVTATVTVTVPAILPGTGFHVTRHATMPCPGEGGP